MAAYLKTMIAGGAAPGGRILRASTLRQMITPQTNLPLDIAPFRQGLGWWVGDSPLAWMGTVIHHAGHTSANDSEVMWLPGSKLGVFVSVNTHSPGQRRTPGSRTRARLDGDREDRANRPGPTQAFATDSSLARRRFARRRALRQWRRHCAVQADGGVLLLTLASQRPDARRSPSLREPTVGIRTRLARYRSSRRQWPDDGCCLVGPRTASPPPRNVSRRLITSRQLGVTGPGTTARSTFSRTTTPARSRTTPP